MACCSCLKAVCCFVSYLKVALLPVRGVSGTAMSANLGMNR